MLFKEYFQDWVGILREEEIRDVLKGIGPVQAGMLCPEYKDIFRAFHLCPYRRLKAVLIGQDPYPQRGVATGILFGNKEGTDEKKFSPSLKVVIEAVVNFEIPHSGVMFDPTLESWAKQGILLINSALTTKVNGIGAHVMLWRPFMVNLLRRLSANNSGLIYILFGERAKSLKPYIDERNNIILEERHPAYYARQGMRMPSTVFNELTRLTEQIYGKPVELFKEYKMED